MPTGDAEAPMAGVLQTEQQQPDLLPFPQAAEASPPHRTPPAAWPPPGVSDRNLGRAGTLKSKCFGSHGATPLCGHPIRAGGVGLGLPGQH